MRFDNLIRLLYYATCGPGPKLHMGPHNTILTWGAGPIVCTLPFLSLRSNVV